MSDDDASAKASLQILTEMQGMLQDMEADQEQREKNAFVQGVTFDDDASMTFALVDGRKVSVPLALFPRLRDATPEQRQNWERDCCGIGVHWPDIGETVEAYELLCSLPLPQMLAWKRRVAASS